MEKLSNPLASLSASVRKVANKEKAAQEVTALQQKYKKVLESAKEKQSLLETLLAQWQKWVNSHNCCDGHRDLPVLRVWDWEDDLVTLGCDFVRQEKELSAFLAWLEGCEATARPSEQYVSADRVKLEGELQTLQVCFNWNIVPLHFLVYFCVFQRKELPSYRLTSQLILGFGNLLGSITLSLAISQLLYYYF